MSGPLYLQTACKSVSTYQCDDHHQYLCLDITLVYIIVLILCGDLQVLDSVRHIEGLIVEVPCSGDRWHSCDSILDAPKELPLDRQLNDFWGRFAFNVSSLVSFVSLVINIITFF